MSEFLNKLRNMQQSPVQSQQQELTRIASARGGKGTAAVGPKASNIQEQTAIANVRGQQRQQQQQANIMASYLEEQQRQQTAQTQFAEKSQNQKFSEALKGLQQQQQMQQEQQAFRQQQGQKQLDTQYRLSTQQISNEAQQGIQKLAQDRNLDVNNLFREFNYSSLQLEDRKDAADLEQRAFMYSLSDQKYLKQLQSIGQQRQLADQLNFQRETLDIALGNELSSVLDELEFKEALSADQHTFARKLADINLDQALQIARAQARSEATTSVIKGATGAASGVLGYYGNKGEAGG